MSSKPIACVEVPSTANIHCPFCGQQVLNPASEDPENYFSVCPHTLFVAHDMGFEFRSERFDAAAGITGVDGDDIDLPEHGIDGLTSQVAIEGAVKFASYVPPPSFYGSYVGFAPTE